MTYKNHRIDKLCFTPKDHTSGRPLNATQAHDPTNTPHARNSPARPEFDASTLTATATACTSAAVLWACTEARTAAESP